MKAINKLRKKRAVSPVIATVIIVAVTITVAVAVSYWMSGIASQYTSFEKIEIQTAICKYVDVETPPPVDHWLIEVHLKNSGTKAAALTHVFINEVESGYAKAAPQAADDPAITAQLDPLGATEDGSDPLHIESGDTGTVYVWIESVSGYITLTSGTTINIKIHSASGMDYIRLVQLN